jgi:multisubunit Na+/H+ antiporter MnhB subunit
MMNEKPPGPLLRLLLGSMLAATAAWLGYVVLVSAPASPELVDSIARNLDRSGVSNPVTAVLLNFRGYDTLLEMSVLMLALFGIAALDSPPRVQAAVAGPVLRHIPELLVPLLLLISGYLLWVGAYAPGGAFQAGAVLGASGILLALGGWEIHGRVTGWPLRFALVIGLATFLTVAALPLIGAGGFLQYPHSAAGPLILVIESTATISIGVTLVILFLGGLPGNRGP